MFCDFALFSQKNNGLSTSDTNLMQIKQPRIISRKRYNDSSLPESIIKNKHVNKLNTQKQASKRYRMKKRNEEMIIFEKIKIEASKYESLLNLKNQCQIAIRNVLEYVLDKVQITDKISLIQNFRKNGLKYCTEHLYELLSNMVMAKIDLNEANNAYNDINDENILNINDPHLESIVNHIPVEIENVDKDTQLNEFQELFDNGADNMNELKLNLNLTLLSSSKMLLVNGPME